jgi:hypothetical protein
MKPNDLDTVLLAQGLIRSLASYSTVLFWGLLTVLVFLTFVWAAFFRRSSSRYPARRHHSKPKDPAPGLDAASTASDRGASRRRRRRRAKRSLNPTLAQTHGLPPVRDEKSTPPPAY